MLPLTVNFQSIENGKETDLGSIIRNYCNFGYVLALCPFRLSTEKNGKLTTKVWWPQKILCMLTSSVVSMSFTSSIRKAFTTLIRPTGRKYPIQVFSSALELCEIAIIMGTLKLIWFGNQKFLTPHSFLVSKSNALSIRKETALNIKILLMGLGMLTDLGIVLLREVFAYERNRSGYWIQMYEWGRATFYFEKLPDVHFNGTVDAGQAQPDVQNLLTMTALISKTLRCFKIYLNYFSHESLPSFSFSASRPHSCSLAYAMYFDLLLITLSCVLWVASRSFALSLRRQLPCAEEVITGLLFTKTRRRLSFWPEIKSQYDSLKQLSELINDIIGIKSACYLVRVTLFYAIVCDTMKTWKDLIEVLLFLCGTLTFLLMSADVVLQVDKCRILITS